MGRAAAVDESRGEAEPGAVDGDAERSRAGGLVDGLANLSRVGDVGRHERGRPAELLGQRLAALGVAVEDRARRSVGDEPARRRLAQAGGPAADQCCRAVDVHGPEL